MLSLRLSLTRNMMMHDHDTVYGKRNRSGLDRYTQIQI